MLSSMLTQMQTTINIYKRELAENIISNHEDELKLMLVRVFGYAEVVHDVLDKMQGVTYEHDNKKMHRDPLKGETNV